MDYVNFILTTILFDFMSALLLKKFFSLSVKVIELVFLQIINIAVVVIYLFCEIYFYQFILLKILAIFLISLLITEEYKFFSILKLFAFNMIILFSVFGFFEFIAKLVEAWFNVIFNVKIAKKYKIIVNFIIFVYFYVVFAFFGKIKKDDFKRKYLSTVSFLLFGKHIEIVGLLDTGNTLRDTKTNKPVLVVSLKVLKKYFNNIDFEKNGFRKILCEGAGGFQFYMPIIDIGKVCVSNKLKTKSYECVLGVVDQKFYDEKKYDCLLHRDFV